MLETNIDDMNPEIYSYLFPKLFEAGALDVFLTHIVMKKGRPGVKVSVLGQSKKVRGLEEVLFRETTTLGIRKYSVEREALDREFVKVNTVYGPVTVKIGLTQGKPLKYAPEYEECKTIAARHETPLAVVYQEVMLAAHSYLQGLTYDDSAE